MRRLTIYRSLGFVALAATVWVGCGSSSQSWREQALALKVEGLAFQGDQVGKQSWSGSGFWVSPDLIATNAHVATRAHSVLGEDDNGNKYRFTAISGIDRDGDIAFLRADRKAELDGVTFVTKPEDPKNLRGMRVIVTGNTGGLGISYYEGEITNVVGPAGNEQILHNANTAGGASGSPLFDKDSGKVVGINHSSHPGINSKLASSSWRIEKGLADAKDKWGASLSELFTLQNLLQLAQIQVRRNFCLQPGQAFKVPFNSPRITDLVVAVQTKEAEDVLVAGFRRGDGQVLWKGAIKQKAVLPFMFNTGGPHDVVLISPPQLNRTVCGVLGIGAVPWEAGIK